MVSNCIDIYPDYMKEIKGLKQFCRGSDWEFSEIKSEANKIVNDVTYIRGTMSDRMQQILDVKVGLHVGYDLGYLFRKLENVTVDDYKAMFEIWTRPTDYTLDFDLETLTVTISCDDNELIKKLYYKRMRDVLPCNMVFVFNDTGES